jgi:hypothetical protein
VLLNTDSSTQTQLSQGVLVALTKVILAALQHVVEHATYANITLEGKSIPAGSVPCDAHSQHMVRGRFMAAEMFWHQIAAQES